VQDSVAGWLPTRPKDSPTLPVQFSVDRPAYAQLRVPLPKFSNSKHPGRSYVFCRTSLQLYNTDICLKKDSVSEMELLEQTKLEYVGEDVGELTELCWVVGGLVRHKAIVDSKD